MVRPLSLASLLAATLAVSCSYVSPPIQVTGQPADLEALSGEWTGSYQGDGPQGRSGSIRFTLQASEGHAHGDVLMTPKGSRRPYQRYRSGEPVAAEREFPAPSESLTIQFVRVEDGTVMGTLDPYWDPDRECQAYTTFVGRVRGNTIEGTFKSTYSRPAADTVGRWRVARH